MPCSSPSESAPHGPSSTGWGGRGREGVQAAARVPSHFSAFETKCSVVVAVRLQKGVRSPIAPVLATKLVIFLSLFPCLVSSDPLPPPILSVLLRWEVLSWKVDLGGARSQKRSILELFFWLLRHERPGKMLVPGTRALQPAPCSPLLEGCGRRSHPVPESAPGPTWQPSAALTPLCPETGEV